MNQELKISEISKRREWYAKISFSRHGLSEWNKLNQFTGWADVDLAPEGVEEAKEGGRKIKEAGIEFDVAYTSVLTRAIKTCDLIFRILWSTLGTNC